MAYQKIENYPSIKTKGVYPSGSIKQLGLDSDDDLKVFIGKLDFNHEGGTLAPLGKRNRMKSLLMKKANLFLFLLMNPDLKWVSSELNVNKTITDNMKILVRLKVLPIVEILFPR